MNGSPWGGSEELWYKTALYLSERGTKVGCAFYDWPQKKERIQALEKAGVAVYRLPNKKIIRGSFLVKLLLKLQVKKKLAQALKGLPVDSFDKVVVNLGGFELYTSPWKTFYQRLHFYAILFHSYDDGQKFSLKQKKGLATWLHHASVNLFAAQKAKEVIERQAGAEISNTNVFINPISFVPPGVFSSYPELANGCYIFSMFAALDTHRKSQDKLIAVLASAKWKERPWKLYLYGEGMDYKKLAQLILDTGLQEKVFLKGHCENVLLAMRQSHLILQVTAIDAMPLSVMEAMAAGRPLVVTNVGDMPLWVKQQENGWVCNDDKNIDDCLEEAWQNKDRWPAMAAAAFYLFRQKFPANVEETFIKRLDGNS